jgi:hypothetical protein
MTSRFVCPLLLAALGCGCAHLAKPSVATQGPEARTMVERVLSVALQRYALENRGRRAPVCVIGDLGQPWPQSVLVDVPAEYLGRPNCQKHLGVIVALVTEVGGSSRYTVDVRESDPPCGGYWECWLGPSSQVVYQVWGLSPRPLILAYRALVLDGNLVGSETEYETRTRLIERRLGATAE